jgi:hypothetical protein
VVVASHCKNRLSSDVCDVAKGIQTTLIYGGIANRSAYADRGNDRLRVQGKQDLRRNGVASHEDVFY